MAAAQSSSLICILIGRRYASEREPAVDRKGRVISRTIRKREQFGCTTESLEKLYRLLYASEQKDGTHVFRCSHGSNRNPLNFVNVCSNIIYNTA